MKTIRKNRSRLDILQSSLLAVLLLFTSVQLFAEENAAAESLFTKRCGICHALPDPSHPPPEGWEARLDKMAPLARLKKKQKGEILEFLVSHTKKEVMTSVVANDLDLVKQKCSTCHTLGRVVLESFNGDTGKHILDRMQRYAGTDYLSDDDLVRIQNYLQHKEDGKLAALPAVPKSDIPEDVFRSRCTACHTLERVLKLVGSDETSDAAWVHIVTRMKEKAPQWISQEEALTLASYIQSLEMQTGSEN